MQKLMNKLTYSILIFISIIILGCGAANQSGTKSSSKPTRKSGVINEDENWSGNILIEDDITVPEGVTLTIQPGAIVGFYVESKKKMIQFTVNGTLYAEGNEQRPIRFTSLTMKHNPGDWAGITFGKTSLNSSLSFNIIQYHQQILVRSDSLRITNNIITNGSGAGIICDSASPFIEDNEITKNEIGIKCVGNTSTEISRNLIRANTYGIVCEDGATPKITRNIISDNRQDGIISYSASSPTITSNNILRNVGWAVYNGGRLSDNFIQGNNKAGPSAVERGTEPTSEQYYGVEEVEQPRSSEVMDAGPHERR
ncbi:TPA: right-handed parallel beta-helix repeat-containing protein [Candidatus Poribacteria bacterium]|nr:right-handed parallel beta-helix repeat-containing protein [Candidatus Poribacteria bacterium]